MNTNQKASMQNSLAQKALVQRMINQRIINQRIINQRIINQRVINQRASINNANVVPVVKSDKEMVCNCICVQQPTEYISVTIPENVPEIVLKQINLANL
jgi:hypothetical protein